MLAKLPPLAGGKTAEIAERPDQAERTTPHAVGMVLIAAARNGSS